MLWKLKKKMQQNRPSGLRGQMGDQRYLVPGIAPFSRLKQPAQLNETFRLAAFPLPQVQ